MTRGIYTNMQGLINNYKHVETLAENKKPDIMVLSETHLMKDVEENEATTQRYGQIMTVSDSTRTVGVSIYYRKNWRLGQITEKTNGLKNWMSEFTMASINLEKQSFVSISKNLSMKYINTTMWK